MNFKFYLISTLIFFVTSIVGFLTGAKVIYNLLFPIATNPYGEEALTFIPFLIGISLLGSFVGLLVGLILIHRLGRRWGSRLSFGSHPVLKLTFLSFLTFLGLLVLLLLLLPTKP